jgi:hypothetical protein
MRNGVKAERICLITVGTFLAVVTSGCRERNPAYVSPWDGSSAAGRDGQGDGNADVSRDASDGRRRDASADDANGGRDAVADDAAPDGAKDDGTGLADVVTPDARDANRDGRDARDDGGADGARDQALPDVAGDGTVVDLGMDAGGAVDGPPACLGSEKRSCSSPGNPLLGACNAGTQTCSGGFWGACVGEVTPTSESCNGADDNCNGMIDEGCMDDCVVVAPTGDDGVADGTPAHPFATIAGAMRFATSLDGGPTGKVCVAGGASCADRKTYAQSGPLGVLDGARVQGNYALSGTSLSYCPGTFPPNTTLQFPASDDAIVFGATVQSAEFGGFGISRQAADNPTTGSMAGVVVSSGKVSLSTLLIGEQSGVENTYGVDVEGGDVVLTGSSIGAGQGTASVVGVLVNGGTVNIRNNCTLDGSGLCASSCGSAGTLGIRSRAGAAGGPAAASAESSAIYAKDGTAWVVGNNLCGGGGNGATAGKDGSLATLRCENGACATIAANAIAATTSNVKQLATVSLADGGGLVDGNVIQGGCASDYAATVLLSNASARLQNNRLMGATCTGSGTFYGVRVLLGGATGEPDLNSNDIEPAGGAGDCRSVGVSIERPAGATLAASILRNNILSTGVCRKRFAVQELSDATARVVQNNDLYAPATPTPADTTVLYRRGSTDAVTADQVNALAGAADNIATDPLFVAAPADLHLSSGSPCVDRGSAVGAPATDIAGTSRPQGAGFDIGAYELAVP